MSWSVALRGGVAVAALSLSLVAGGAFAAETIKLGVREFPPARGNPFVDPGVPHVFALSAIYNQMTKIREDFSSGPDLATEWKVVDPTTWEVKVRTGIRFSNGEAFTAAAVEAAYKYLLTEEGRALVAGRDLTPIFESMTARDDGTVIMKTKTPFPIVPRVIGGLRIPAPKVWADGGLKGMSDNPVGTAAYKVQSWVPGKIVLVASESSFERRADVGQIELYDIGEGAARAQALLSGQIDIDTALNLDSVDQVKRAGLKVFQTPSTRTLGISLVSWRKTCPDGKCDPQPTTGPMKDLRVRQALNYAVNKQTIVDNIYKGAASVATQAAVPQAFGFNKDLKGYEHNPARAKQLLTEAGFPNGFDMEIRAITTDATFKLVYESAVQDLNAAGVRARLISQPFPDWLSAYLNGTWSWDAFGFGHDLTGQLDAGRSFNSFTSCIKPGGPYYCNQDEMPLVTAQAQEMNAVKREAILKELLAKNAANAPIIFLVAGTENMGHHAKLTNFKQVNLHINYTEMRVQK
jgi:peptide/nickel transport system substrate-binding protein